MLKDTRQRRVIKNIFEKTEQPLNPEDVLAEAQKEIEIDQEEGQGLLDGKELLGRYLGRFRIHQAVS